MPFFQLSFRFQTLSVCVKSECLHIAVFCPEFIIIICKRIDPCSVELAFWRTCLKRMGTSEAVIKLSSPWRRGIKFARSTLFWKSRVLQPACGPSVYLVTVAPAGGDPCFLLLTRSCPRLPLLLGANSHLCSFSERSSFPFFLPSPA